MAIGDKHPILYDRLENKIAVLDMAYGVKVTERLQQEWSIEFYHPLDESDKWTLIETECLVEIDGQKYVLKVVEPDDSNNGILIHCQGDHVSIQALEEYIDPADDSSLGRTSFLLGVDATTALTNALKGTRFSVGVVSVTGVYDIDLQERNLQDILKEMETTWNGEMQFDNWTVNFVPQMGQSNGVVFRYRKNNKSIKRTEDTRNLCTRLYGYGSGGMTIEGVHPTKYLDASTINNYSHPFKLKKDYANIDDPTTLMNAMQADLNDLSVPKVTYELSVVELAKVAGYPYPTLESFGLGDYVTVIDERLNDLSIVSRVTEYVRYPYESLNLSTVQIQSLKDTTYDQLKNANSGVTSLLQTVNISPRRNGRSIGTPANGSALSYTTNTDGSVNIDVSWAFTEDATSPIDGFGILVHSDSTNNAYTFPNGIIADLMHVVDKTSRGFQIQAAAADKFYTIAVYAFRNVDSDVNEYMQIRGGLWYANGGVAWQPSATVEFTGLVNGVSASNVASVTANFNARNDRIADIPASPTGLTLSETLNTDGSADISFSWSFTGSDNAHNVDGFLVYVHTGTTSGAYTFGTDVANERIFDVDSSKTSIQLYGAAADSYYAFAIRAYRVVDHDVWQTVAAANQSTGDAIIGALVTATPNPFQPTPNVNYTGNVNGTSATSISTVAGNFNGRNDRLPDIPATPTTLTLTNALNTDGSADIALSWAFTGTDNTHNVDGFLVYVYSSKTNAAYTFGSSPSSERVFDVDSSKSSFILYGVAPDNYYTIGVLAYRIVDHDVWLTVPAANQSTGDIIIGTIATSTPNPYQPSANVSFGGDVTGTVAGVPGDSISKTPATIIVADGSTSMNTKRADYVVPAGATNAEATINQAINALPSTGGKVILLDGTFQTSSAIVMRSNVTLEGQGSSTLIKGVSTGTTYDLIDASNISNYTMANFSMDAHLANHGIYASGTSANPNTNGSVIGVSGTDNSSTSTLIYFTACSNITISRCNLNGGFCGMEIGDSSGGTISNNVVTNNAWFGIFLGTTSGNTTNGISVVGNVAIGNGYGIYVGGHDTSSLVTNVSVTGNTSRNSTNFGIWMQYGDKCTIASNACTANQNSGIYLSYITNSAVVGNTCQNNSDHGIQIVNSSHNSINNNPCTSNGQATNATYDNIQLATNSNYNNVQSNVCRMGSLTNKPRYGVNVYDSTCTGNIVTNNDLYQSGVTGSLNDAGTGTITTAGNRVA